MGGDNTFCPGMGGGHEILTSNGGVQENIICVWGGHEIYLKDWEKGGDGKNTRKFFRAARANHLISRF